MPVKQYFLWVGGVLLCLMLALNAYLPRAEPREEFEYIRTSLRISAPDLGIAPDTGAIAISEPPNADEASKPPAGSKIVASAPWARALANIEPAPLVKPPRKRSARLPA